ncbi:MAG: ABC transporter permease [Flavobacterium sp. JAD_PAG50586_2]|nr:MAG: ABC transporter permease [Flavobacterium sp. JAD_PAG50586_2]
MLAFNLLSLAGIFISLEIFNSKFGTESMIINSICNGNANNDSNTVDNCKKIIVSDKINILGLKLSDFSLIYFLSVFILGILNPQNAFFLKIISYSTTIIILYSLFIQIFIEKALCKVCLLTISILIGHMFIANLLPDTNFSFELLSISLFVFATIFFNTKYINDILKQKNEYYSLNIKNSRFKRDYSIFRKELLEKHFEFKNKSDAFLFGEKKVKLNITLITNPFCGYCKEAHNILEKLIIKYPHISAQMRFNHFKDENLESILSIFKNIYDKEGGQTLLKSIALWYEINDTDKFIKRHPDYSTTTDISEIVRLSDENRNSGLTFTPVFLINNYQFPNKYDKEDIFYFMDEMLEDEEFLNEK